MIRISAIEPSISVVSASRVNETSSPDPSVTRAPSVSSAVSPCFATSTSMPLSSSHSCRSASAAFASSTIPGTVSENFEAWSPIGSASTATIAPRTTISVRNTHSTATPRGKRARWSITTNGFSSSATSAATMKISATGPAARSIRKAPRIASGRTTAWIQRGTTTGATASGRRGCRLLGSRRSAGLRLERRVLDAASADVVLALLHAPSMRTRADGALASPA